MEGGTGVVVLDGDGGKEGDADVDLYEDLEDPFFPVEQDLNSVQTPVSSVTSIASEELEELKDQNSKLALQNAALKKNISCLYKTARLEIERKDDDINWLKKKIKRLEQEKEQVNFLPSNGLYLSEDQFEQCANWAYAYALSNGAMADNLQSPFMPLAMLPPAIGNQLLAPTESHDLTPPPDAEACSATEMKERRSASEEVFVSSVGTASPSLSNCSEASTSTKENHSGPVKQSDSRVRSGSRPLEEHNSPRTPRTPDSLKRVESVSGKVDLRHRLHKKNLSESRKKASSFERVSSGHKADNERNTNHSPLTKLSHKDGETPESWRRATKRSRESPPRSSRSREGAYQQKRKRSNSPGLHKSSDSSVKHSASPQSSQSRRQKISPVRSVRPLSQSARQIVSPRRRARSPISVSRRQSISHSKSPVGQSKKRSISPVRFRSKSPLGKSMQYSISPKRRSQSPFGRSGRRSISPRRGRSPFGRSGRWSISPRRSRSPFDRSGRRSITPRRSRSPFGQFRRRSISPRRSRSPIGRSRRQSISPLRLRKRTRSPPSLSKRPSILSRRSRSPPIRSRRRSSSPSRSRSRKLSISPIQSRRPSISLISRSKRRNTSPSSQQLLDSSQCRSESTERQDYLAARDKRRSPSRESNSLVAKLTSQRLRKCDDDLVSVASDVTLGSLDDVCPLVNLDYNLEEDCTSLGKVQSEASSLEEGEICSLAGSVACVADVAEDCDEAPEVQPDPSPLLTGWKEETKPEFEAKAILSEFEPAVITDAKSNLESGSKSELDSDAKSELESCAKSKVESCAKSELESDLDANFKSESVSNTKSELESCVKSSLESFAKSALESDAKSELESGAKSIQNFNTRQVLVTTELESDTKLVTSVLESTIKPVSVEFDENVLESYVLPCHARLEEDTELGVMVRSNELNSGATLTCTGLKEAEHTKVGTVAAESGLEIAREAGSEDDVKTEPENSTAANTTDLGMSATTSMKESDCTDHIMDVSANAVMKEADCSDHMAITLQSTETGSEKGGDVTASLHCQPCSKQAISQDESSCLLEESDGIPVVAFDETTVVSCTRLNSGSNTAIICEDVTSELPSPGCTAVALTDATCVTMFPCEETAFQHDGSELKGSDFSVSASTKKASLAGLQQEEVTSNSTVAFKCDTPEDEINNSNNSEAITEGIGKNVTVADGVKSSTALSNCHQNSETAESKEVSKLFEMKSPSCPTKARPLSIAAIFAMDSSLELSCSETSSSECELSNLENSVSLSAGENSAKCSHSTIASPTATLPASDTTTVMHPSAKSLYACKLPSDAVRIPMSESALVPPAKPRSFETKSGCMSISSATESDATVELSNNSVEGVNSLTAQSNCLHEGKTAISNEASSFLCPSKATPLSISAIFGVDSSLELSCSETSSSECEQSNLMESSILLSAAGITKNTSSSSTASPCATFPASDATTIVQASEPSSNAGFAPTPMNATSSPKTDAVDTSSESILSSSCGSLAGQLVAQPQASDTSLGTLESMKLSPSQRPLTSGSALEPRSSSMSSNPGHIDIPCARPTVAISSPIFSSRGDGAHILGEGTLTSSPAAKYTVPIGALSGGSGLTVLSSGRAKTASDFLSPCTSHRLTNTLGASMYMPTPRTPSNQASIVWNLPTPKTPCTPTYDPVSTPISDTSICSGLTDPLPKTPVTPSCDEVSDTHSRDSFDVLLAPQTPLRTPATPACDSPPMSPWALASNVPVPAKSSRRNLWNTTGNPASLLSSHHFQLPNKATPVSGIHLSSSFGLPATSPVSSVHDTSPSGVTHGDLRGKLKQPDEEVCARTVPLEVKKSAFIASSTVSQRLPIPTASTVETDCSIERETETEAQCQADSDSEDSTSTVEEESSGSESESEEAEEGEITDSSEDDHQPAQVEVLSTSLACLQNEDTCISIEINDFLENNCKLSTSAISTKEEVVGDRSSSSPSTSSAFSGSVDSVSRDRHQRERRRRRSGERYHTSRAHRSRSPHRSHGSRSGSSSHSRHRHSRHQHHSSSSSGSGSSHRHTHSSSISHHSTECHHPSLSNSERHHRPSSSSSSSDHRHHPTSSSSSAHRSSTSHHHLSTSGHHHTGTSDHRHTCDRQTTTEHRHRSKTPSNSSSRPRHPTRPALPLADTDARHRLSRSSSHHLSTSHSDLHPHRSHRSSGRTLSSSDHRSRVSSESGRRDSTDTTTSDRRHTVTADKHSSNGRHTSSSISQQARTISNSEKGTLN